MKKTMIALALAATAVSGSAMAWTAAGTGGSVELGGSIQITPYSTPWEVMVGAPATALNANITKGAKAVAIPVTKAIPVLGIRTAKNEAFAGRSGITPQIDFKGAVDIDSFVGGKGKLSLAVNDANAPANVIGNISVDFMSLGLVGWRNNTSGNTGQYSAYAPDIGSAYFGGVGKSGPAIATGDVLGIFPGVLDNYAGKQFKWDPANHGQFIHIADSVWSGVYGAGIKAGSDMHLTLTAPAANDTIKWKASMPITVSYQ